MGFVSVKNCIRLLYVISDLLLMIINTDVETILEKIDNPRVGVLQTLSLEKFDKTEDEKEHKDKLIDGKETK